MDKTIRNTNDKNQLHGYYQWYYKNKLKLRGYYKNGNKIGYTEVHWFKETNYHIR